jgi:hypothetical protein
VNWLVHMPQISNLAPDEGPALIRRQACSLPGNERIEARSSFRRLLGEDHSCGTFAQWFKTIEQRKAKTATTRIEVRAISFPDIKLLWSALSAPYVGRQRKGALVGRSRSRQPRRGSSYGRRASHMGTESRECESP